VDRVALRARRHKPLHDQELPSRHEHPLRFGQRPSPVRPVMEGGNSPNDGRARVGQWEPTCYSIEDGGIATPLDAIQQGAELATAGRWVDARGPVAMPRRYADSGSGPAPDVKDAVGRAEMRYTGERAGSRSSTEDHRNGHQRVGDRRRTVTPFGLVVVTPLGPWQVLKRNLSRRHGIG
jgi:hypothetical protein